MDFNTILNDLYSLIFEGLWNRLDKSIRDQQEDQELRQKIKDLAEKYRTHFEQLSLAEEYDWTGLNQFLTQQITSIESEDNLFLGCLNLPEYQQREWAWKKFLRRAQHEAYATTPESQQAVYQYVNLFREIVKRFFLQKIDAQTLCLCGLAVDDVLRETNALLQKYQNEVQQAIDYRGSFAQFLDNIQAPEDWNNPLHYRNSLLRFQGRTQELQILRQFLECVEPVKWMAITGNGGMGKSKLLYHFMKETEAYPDWKTCWLSANQVKDLCSYTTNLQYRCGILLIVDYAGESAQQLGRWLDRANNTRSRPEKIRVILLEREAVDAAQAPQNPQWYQALLGNLRQAKTIKQLCYAPSEGSPVLNLSALGDAELKNLIADYAKARDGRTLNETKQDAVLQWAKTIDHKYSQPRPLVVLMTADAVLDGRSGTQWSVDNLVEHILERDQHHWKTVVCENDCSLYRAVLDVLAYATATGGWKAGQCLPKPLKKQTKQLCELDATRLEALVNALNQQNAVRPVLLPLEPDLIGEYFVLNSWYEKKYNQSWSKLVSLLWQKPFEFATFLNRCIDDYWENSNFQWLFENGMKVLQPMKKSEPAITFYAALLVNLSAKQSAEEAAETVEALHALADEHSGSSEIALVFAMGLFNLSAKQSPEKAAETIKDLHALADEHSGSSEIALVFASGLFNLSNKQPPEKAAETIKNLRTLADEHSGSSEIALAYAEGLVNLSAEQSAEEAAETIKNLRTLADEHSDSSEIALRYAKGLFNLSNKQPPEKAAETIKNLRTLANDHPGSSEIALLYAKSLTNLSDR